MPFAGLPEPYITHTPYMTVYPVIFLPNTHTVYDRTSGDFPAKIIYIHRIYMVLAKPSRLCTA